MKPQNIAESRFADHHVVLIMNVAFRYNLYPCT